jgi:hypothetical protein
MSGLKKILKVTMICLSMHFVTNTVSYAEDAATKDTTASDTKYTGVYNDRQLIPNIMAIHCKMNAENVANDLSLLDKCMLQYLAEINAGDASAREIGLQDYDTLRRASATDLNSTATTKSASIQGFEDELNKYSEATGESNTKFDMESALNNTQAFSTDFANSLRELYIEVIENMAIINYQSLDGKLIIDEAETKEASDKKDDTIDGGEISEVAVTGSKDAKQYLEKFRAMNGEKLAQQKAQYQSILNDPQSNTEQKKEAEKGLRYVEQVESERKK